MGRHSDGSLAGLLLETRLLTVEGGEPVLAPVSPALGLYSYTRGRPAGLIVMMFH